MHQIVKYIKKDLGLSVEEYIAFIKDYKIQNGEKKEYTVSTWNNQIKVIENKGKNYEFYKDFHVKLLKVFIKEKSKFLMEKEIDINKF